MFYFEQVYICSTIISIYNARCSSQVHLMQIFMHIITFLVNIYPDVLWMKIKISFKSVQSYNNSLFSTFFITTFFFLLAIVCLGFLICNLIEPFILSISNFKIDLNETTDHWLILIVKIQIVQFNSLTQPGLFNFFLLLAFLIVH